MRWMLSATLVAGAATSLLVLSGGIGAPAASAITAPVNLGVAHTYAVLAHSTITNSGPTVVSGNLGLYPGTAVTGFSPTGAPTGIVIDGTEQVTTHTAELAQTSLTTAYLNAQSAPSTNSVSANLAGQTLVSGVYTAASTSMALTGVLILNGQHDPNSVFIFQAGSTLVTGSGSAVELINGAQACNVFWQVGSSATLGTGSHFVGSVLAMTSVTVTTGVTVTGRVLARAAAVTLTDDKITRPTTCITATSTSSPPTTTTTTTAPPTTTTTAPPTTTTTAPPTTTTTTSPVSPVATSPGGSGGSNSGAPTVIPSGAPQTGLGGASRSGDNLVLVVLGGLALIGAGAALDLAARRRRMSLARARATATLGRDGSG